MICASRHAHSRRYVQSYRHPVNYLVTLYISSSLVSAAPSSSPLVSRQTNDSSGGGQGGTNVQAQIWAPIIAVVVVFLGVSILLCTKPKWRGRLGRMPNWSAGAALASGTVARFGSNFGPREFTAEQLAGTTTEETTTSNPPTARTNRRARRNNRRTPSQISTRSLPVYMKEPGDQELVIYRGPDDMEDAPTTVVAMPPVDEDGPETPESSVDISRISSHVVYVPMPDSPHDQPLLHPDESLGDTDRSGQSLVPPVERVTTRSSYDTLPESEESESALLHDPPSLDPRGEAPPYFEVVAMEDLTRSPSLPQESPSAPLIHSPLADVPVEPSTDSTGPEQTGGTRRRSVFFNLFHPRNSTSSHPPVPPLPTQSESGHARTESGPSIVSRPSTSNDGHARARSRSTHRPSHSGSGSVFSIGSSAFRTLSRTKSNTNLLDPNFVSPSTISVNSISAPLTHTLVRTEFTYPKSGPTPEQLKLISSRESFARFGVPYGRDAIAYASHSRLDLSLPPPEFEAVERPSSALAESSRAESSPNLSNRGPSRLAQVSTPDPEDVSLPESPAEQPTELPDVSTPMPAPSSSEQQASTSMTQAAAADVSSTPASSSATPSTQLPIPSPNQRSTAAPPSSFKSSGSTSGRSESRASSYLSYATAEESLSSVPSTPVVLQLQIDEPTPLPSPTVTAPSTPRMTARHVHEDTDMTVTDATLTTPTLETPIPPT